MWTASVPVSSSQPCRSRPFSIENIIKSLSLQYSSRAIKLTSDNNKVNNKVIPCRGDVGAIHVGQLITMLLRDSLEGVRETTSVS